METFDVGCAGSKTTLDACRLGGPKTMQPDSLHDTTPPAGLDGSAEPKAPSDRACPLDSATQPDQKPAEPPTTEPRGSRAHDRSAHADARPERSGPRRGTSTDFETVVQAVRIDQIDGVDEDIEQFLNYHDHLTEVAIDRDRWSRELIGCAVHDLHLTLWSKRGRLVHLGSGRKLTLARRLARHDETLPASVIQAKTLTLQQKLNFVAHELLLLQALYRPTPGQTAAMVALLRALERAGVEPIRKPGLRNFALATGMSVAAVKPHWPAT